MSSSIPYDFVPGREEARLNPRRKALENYGARLDVHEPLYHFVTDLLQAQPTDPYDYMLKWATAEKKNPNRISSPFRMDMTNDKYNLKVDLQDKTRESTQEKRTPEDKTRPVKR
ncbi:hypothetical protein R1flu_012560 [Riccia fluitans]|uniref:Uncharacterized protein n=1 Tax=Riccia fluitans TaxID=41844 RepID=A0ABD1ZC40_9MARC